MAVERRVYLRVRRVYRAYTGPQAGLGIGAVDWAVYMTKSRAPGQSNTRGRQGKPRVPLRHTIGAQTHEYTQIPRLIIQNFTLNFGGLVLGSV